MPDEAEAEPQAGEQFEKAFDESLRSEDKTGIFHDGYEAWLNSEEGKKNKADSDWLWGQFYKNKMSEEEYDRRKEIVDEQQTVGIEKVARALFDKEQRNKPIEAPDEAEAEIAGEPGGGEVPTIRGDDEYNQLPSGTVFVGPDGQKRKKP